MPCGSGRCRSRVLVLVRLRRARPRATPVRFANVTPSAPVTIDATLVRPRARARSRPWCSSTAAPASKPQSYRWARWLAERGYVALVVDSFGPRGVKGDCRTGPDEPPITARFDDAFGALALSAGAAVRPRGPRGRHRLVAGRRLRDGRHQRAEPRARAAARRGAARGRLRGRHRRLSRRLLSLVKEQVIRPLLVLIGGADDWTPAAECREMVEAMRARGADVHDRRLSGRLPLLRRRGAAARGARRAWRTTKPGRHGATVSYQAEAAADAHRQVEALPRASPRAGLALNARRGIAPPAPRVLA